MSTSLHHLENFMTRYWDLFSKIPTAHMFLQQISIKHLSQCFHCCQTANLHISKTNSSERILEKGGNYTDVLPLKATWCDRISNLNLLELQIWAADEPNVVSFRITVGRHINAALRVCDGLGQNKIVRVGIISGLILSSFWTKVHEILWQCRRPIVLSNALARLSTLRFVQQIFAIKSRSRWKTKQMQVFLVFGPRFCREGRDETNFYMADC